MSRHERSEVPRGQSCSCKVGRNVESYDLGDLDGQLLDERADGASLRDLETVVNEAILRRALRDADADVIGDVSSIYATLTDDEASAGERTEVSERLSRAGVDVSALRADFVSYQTVRTHLRECLDVETNREERLTPADARGTIAWARSRSEGIVERTIERLRDADGVSAGDVDVTHVVRVSCRDCGRTFPVETFVDRGGCDCDPAVADDADGATAEAATAEATTDETTANAATADAATTDAPDTADTAAGVDATDSPDGPGTFDAGDVTDDTNG